MIYHGDCLEILPTLPAESIDSIVTDPPYGLSFMGKNWDHGVPGVAFWSEALRVAKPGAHLLAFGGTRTFHRLTCAIEDAGWEIRDCVMWVYGSGFTKGFNLNRVPQCDCIRGDGIENRATVDGHRGSPPHQSQSSGQQAGKLGTIREPQSPLDAGALHGRGQCPRCGKLKKEFAGFSTSLKPAWEPIIVARKPLVGTVAENVQAYGTGAFNVDGCRVEGMAPVTVQGQSARAGEVYGADQRDQRVFEPHASGRWPANVIHDGSDEVVGLMGEAARFFYVPKASKADRDEGCEGIDERLSMRYGEKAQGPLPQQTPSKPVAQRNHHPTVKPTALMRYLCRLVTPTGGTVLDPFCGSGSTGKAATLEGFSFIGIEREAEYVEIARARIAHAKSAYSSTGASK